MRVSVLASGSKGNCILVNDDETAILVDAGISARKIKKELSALHVNIEDLDGIFITHEHIDHVRGIKTLLKNHHIPLYTRADTFKSLSCIKDIPAECCHVITATESVGNMQIRPFSISHDAADPVGYNIVKKTSPLNSVKLTIATDLGFVTDNVKTAMEQSNILVLEANHDLNMLQNGPYPWSLKKRILGTRGHLSNNDAAIAIKNLQAKPEALILAHLSEKNNTPALASQTISSLMQRFKIDEIPLNVASQDKATTVTI